MIYMIYDVLRNRLVKQAHESKKLSSSYKWREKTEKKTENGQNTILSRRLLWERRLS